MNVVLWVIAGLLAAVFVSAGAMKLSLPKKRLADSGLGWVEDFSDSSVKAIGAVEVLGGLGLILPTAVNVAPVLVPLAATGLAAMMIGAASVHIRRREPQMVAVNVVLFALAVFVAWGRFGPYSF